MLLPCEYDSEPPVTNGKNVSRMAGEELAGSLLVGQ